MADEKKITFGNYSIIGDRDYQQDSFLSCRKMDGMMLAAVFDGMGGMHGGDLASETGRKVIQEHFVNDQPFIVQEADSWIRYVLKKANEKVCDLTDENGNPMGAGSTCILIVADQESFQWGCTGDSRIYLYRENCLYTLTRMHNLKLYLQNEEGLIPPDKEMLAKEKGEQLISYLGRGESILIDTSTAPIKWKKGDILVLCSDGLYKALDDFQIKAIVEEGGENPQLIATRLCKEAYRLAENKQDNTTVIAVVCPTAEEEAV